jgi:hypothetical protein
VLLVELCAGRHVRPGGNHPLGEGLVGQCALENRRILLTDVPTDFVAIGSSLGRRGSVSVVVLPVLFENQTKAVIELASLQPFTDCQPELPRPAGASHRRVFNTIEATMRPKAC